MQLVTFTVSRLADGQGNAWVTRQSDDIVTRIKAEYTVGEAAVLIKITYHLKHYIK